MDQSSEFTPKERYMIELYKNPQQLVSSAVKRAVLIILPSLVFVLAAMTNQDYYFALIAYVFLLVNTIYRLVLTKKGAAILSSIVLKYEAQLNQR